MTLAFLKLAGTMKKIYIKPSASVIILKDSESDKSVIRGRKSKYQREKRGGKGPPKNAETFLPGVTVSAGWLAISRE